MSGGCRRGGLVAQRQGFGGVVGEEGDLGEGTDRVSLSGQVQHVEGYAPGAWWDRRVVSADRVVNPNGTASTLVDSPSTVCGWKRH